MPWCCHRGIAIASTAFTWWIQNRLQATTYTQIKPTEHGCKSACRLPSSTFIIAIYCYYCCYCYSTQSWHSFYLHTEGRIQTRAFSGEHRISFWGKNLANIILFTRLRTCRTWFPVPLRYNESQFGYKSFIPVLGTPLCALWWKQDYTVSQKRPTYGLL